MYPLQFVTQSQSSGAFLLTLIILVTNHVAYNFHIRCLHFYRTNRAIFLNEKPVLDDFEPNVLLNSYCNFSLLVT